VEVADTAAGRAALPDSLDTADQEAHSLTGLTQAALESSVAEAEAHFMECIQQDPAKVLVAQDPHLPNPEP
jgi:hypothetical protein